MKKKLMFVVNTDAFFLSHRLPIALRALEDGYEVYVASKHTGFGDDIRAHGLRPLSLDLNRRGLGIGSNIHTFVQLLNIFNQVKPDIVHLVTIKPVLFGGLAARITRIQGMVAAISGMGFLFIAQGVKAKITRFIVGLLYRLALGHPNLKIIFQNKDDQETLEKILPIPSSVIELIPGAGVDLNDYQLTPEPKGSHIVLMASRLLIDKGVREFADAARILKPSYPNIRFVLVGEIDPGNPATLTEVELQQWVSQNIVEHWGSRNDMPYVFSLSSIVVLPSYREGFPKVLMEAAASGRPVITTDVPGCRDAIKKNGTGLLVESRNSSSLADAIRKLVENPELRKRMGHAGRKLAERAFDVRRVVAKHLNIYDKLLQNR